ncbi:MAG: hypothetical protein QM627_08730 [Luteolibacter sp.]
MKRKPILLICMVAGTFSSNVHAQNFLNIGDNNTLRDSYGSSVLGGSNYVCDQYASLVAGTANYANDGDYNILLGSDNGVESAHLVVLLGYNNVSYEDKSYILGEGNLGQEDTVTLGTYAETVNNASLIVGTGSSVNRKNGLVVLRNDEVRIPGTLSVLGSSVNIAGSPVITSASAPTVLGGQGFLTTSTLPNSIKNLPALVVGSTNSVSNGGLIAFGSQSNASGNSAIAMGVQANATGAKAVALGESTLASGEGAFASGIGAEAKGDYSLAVGNYSSANGFAAVAFGDGAQSNGESSFAAGLMAVANGHNSSAMGDGTLANAYSECVVGTYNVPSSVDDDYWPTPNTWEPHPLGPAFQVGNGTWETRSNAMTVLKNGQTQLKNKGWNASNPTAVPTEEIYSSGEALLIEGHSRVKGNSVIEGNTVLEGTVTISQPQGDISMGIYQ